MAIPEPVVDAPQVDPLVAHFTEMLGTWGKDNPKLVSHFVHFQRLMIHTKVREHEKGFEREELDYILHLAINATTGQKEPEPNYWQKPLAESFEAMITLAGESTGADPATQREEAAMEFVPHLMNLLDHGYQGVFDFSNPWRLAYKAALRKSADK